MITFSSPVTFSQGFADLNTWDESVTNFSAAPSSVAINPGHAWNGTTLTFAGSTKPDSSTLTWQGITSLTFDFVNNNAAEFLFTDAQVARVSVPEPSTTAMVLAGLACGGWQLVRRARR